MDQNELHRLIKTLSDLGIVSDKRTTKLINAGVFRMKYPVNNFLITSDEINNIINDNPKLDRYKALRLILNEVINLNKTDYFALTGIYSALAWAAFDCENKDHFIMNQKRVYAHFMFQYDANFAEQNKGFIKTRVIIIPDKSNCDKCKKLAVRKFEVDEFLANIPIPCRGCSKSNGICIALGQPVSTLL